MIDEQIVNQVLLELKKDGFDCFASEAQLRDAFAIKIGSLNKNWIPIPEYTQVKPNGWGCSEDLIHFDLLICDKELNEKILIEFKYKTKEANFITSNGLYIELHDQSDSTNGRYAIWRDIYRIETFANLNTIDKGFIVFITNNMSYNAIPRPNTLSEQFSIAEGMHYAGNHEWNTTDSKNCTSIHKEYRKDIHPLPITNNYYFNYSEYSNIRDSTGKIHSFQQLVLPIYSQNYLRQLKNNLNKIGKESFIEFFRFFKENEIAACKQNMIAKKYTKASIETKISSGILMFKRGDAIQALRFIISANKIKEDIKLKTVELLKEELHPVTYTIDEAIKG